MQKKGYRGKLGLQLLLAILATLNELLFTLLLSLRLLQLSLEGTPHRRLRLKETVRVPKLFLLGIASVLTGALEDIKAQCPLSGLAQL